MRPFLVILIGALALAAPASGQPAPLAGDTAACSAIAAAIEDLVLRHHRDAVIVLWHETAPVREQVVVAEHWREVREAPGLDPTTWASFVARNERAEPTCRTLPLRNRLLHRSPATDGASLSDVDAESYWRRFHALYPGAAGSTSTSGVGLSRDGRQALLLLDHACGSLCGSGHTVLLQRDGAGRWRIRATRMTWVS